MNCPQDIDILMKELDNLKKSKQKVIVEGKLDRDALDDLGIENVFVLHRPGTGISSRIEQLMNGLHKKESCVILTDLDKKGEEYYNMLKKELMENGFKVDDKVREILTKLMISHIEGLSSFVTRNYESHQ